MRTRRLLIVFMSLVVLLLGLTLSSCDFLNGLNGTEEGSDSGNKTDKDNSTPASDGWETIPTVSARDAYSSLVVGCANIAYQGSEESLKKTGALTLNSKIKVTVGETDFWISANGKYKTSNPNLSTIASVDLSTTETISDESRVASVGVYDGNLYVAIGTDNKVRIAIPSNFWEMGYFPYKMENPTGNATISNLVGILQSCVVANGAISGEYRRSQDEYHYKVDIDLDETVSLLATRIATLSEDKVLAGQIKEFIANLFGSTVTQLENKELPESALSLDFITTKGILTTLKFGFTVDLDETKSLLFDGKDMIVKVVMEKLSIGKDYSSFSVAFGQSSNASEREKYKPFEDNIYHLSVPLSEYVKDGSGNLTEQANVSLLEVTTRMFQGKGKDDYVFIKYSDYKTKEMKRGVFIYKNICYFYSEVEGSAQYVCSFDVVDLGLVAEKLVYNDWTILNNEGQNVGLTTDSKIDVFKVLTYVLRSITFTDKMIKFSITEPFFSDVWYNFNDLCNFADVLVEEDLYEREEVENYREFVKNNQIILSLDVQFPFLSVVSDTDKEVADVVAMLAEADLETEKRLEKSAEASFIPSEK